VLSSAPAGCHKLDVEDMGLGRLEYRVISVRRPSVFLVSP